MNNKKKKGDSQELKDEKKELKKDQDEYNTVKRQIELMEQKLKTFLTSSAKKGKSPSNSADKKSQPGNPKKSPVEVKLIKRAHSKSSNNLAFRPDENRPRDKERGANVSEFYSPERNLKALEKSLSITKSLPR